MQELSNLESYSLDHLGIVAGIVDEIGLVEEIDAVLGQHPQEVVSNGLAVKAMILNGLGFVSAPLYLFERFFIGKPTEHLLGQGVKPEHLSDDKLGKVLDRLHAANLSQLFVRVAMKACEHYGVKLSVLHLDASSFHVHGAYETERKRGGNKGGDGVSEEVIHITYGYSREHRLDLRQFLVDLLAANDEGVPVFFDAASGNSADKERFREVIRQFRSPIDLDALFVGDSALYTTENLQALAGLRWVTRVPLTLSEAKQVLDEVESEALQVSSIPGYRIVEKISDYGGVQQRWLIVKSEAAEARVEGSHKKKLRRLERELDKELRMLMRRAYHCEADALAAARTLASKLNFHHLENVTVTPKKRYLRAGRPSLETPAEVTCQLRAELVPCPEAIVQTKRRASRFILASNVWDIPADELLAHYKDQQVVERGFRFLRDPLFFTSSVFLKLPQRVMALAMVMALCLLVYTLGRRLMRANLSKEQASIPDQKGKPTQRPTLRWVFQMLMPLHLVTLAGQKLITNLTEERKHALRFFSPSCRKYYLLQ